MGLASLIIGVAIGLTLLVLLIMRKRGRENEDGGLGNLDFALNLAAAIFLIVLAYAVVLGRDAIVAAQNDVAAEAESLVEMYWSVAPLPASATIRGDVRRYVNQSMEQDWPLMAKGGLGTEAGQTLTRLRTDIQRLRPPDDSGKNLQSEALTRAGEVSHSRYIRASNAGSYLPNVMMAIMVVSGLAMIAFPWLLGQKPTMLSIVGDLTRVLIVAVGIVFVLQLSHPFSGVAPVDTAPLQDALAQFDKIDAIMGSS